MPQSSGEMTPQQGHGLHHCHACGWSFPNPHPSAKQRRAHKKHCGRIEGYASMKTNGEISDESNRGGAPVGSEVGEFKRSEQTGREEEVGCLSNLGTSEENVEGETVKCAGGPSLCSGFQVTDDSAKVKLENGSHSTDNSGIDSSRREVSSSANSDSFVLNGLEEILPTLPRSSPTNASTAKSHTYTVHNVAPCSISLDSSDKAEYIKAEPETEMPSVSASDIDIKMRNSKLDNLVARSMAANGSSVDNSVCKMELSRGTHLVSKDGAELGQQVTGKENSACVYHGEVETLKHKDVAAAVETGFTNDVGDRKSSAKIVEDTDNQGPQATENKSSQSLCSMLVNFEDCSVQKNNDEDETRAMHREHADHLNGSSCAKEIDTAGPVGTSLPVQIDSIITNIEGHAICKTVVESESVQKASDNATSGSSFFSKKDTGGNEAVCIMNSNRREDTVGEENLSRPNGTGTVDAIPFANKSPGITSDGILIRNVEELASVESSNASEVHHASSHSLEIENCHVTVSSETLDEQDGCIKTSKVDGVQTEIKYTKQEESTAGFIQNGQYSGEGNSVRKLNCDAILNEGEAFKGTESLSAGSVLDIPEINVPKEQVDHGNNLGKDVSKTSSKNVKGELLDGQKTNSGNLVNLAVQLDYLIASSDTPKEPSGDWRNTSDDPAISSPAHVMEHVGEDIPSEKVTYQDISHDIGLENLKKAANKDSAAPHAFERSDVPCDVNKNIDENSSEMLAERNSTKSAVAVELLAHFETDQGSTELIQGQEPGNPASPKGTIDVNTTQTIDDVGEHYLRGESCSSQPDTRINAEGTSAFEEKREACQSIKASQICSHLQLSEVPVGTEVESRGTDTTNSLLENAPSILLCSEKGIQVASVVLETGNYEPSLAKAEVQIEETDSQNMNGKHPSLGMIAEQHSKVVFNSPDPESSRIDAPKAALGCMQHITFESDLPEEYNLHVTSKGSVHLEQGDNDSVQRQLRATAISVPCASVDYMSGAGHSTEPSTVSREGIQVINSQQPNEIYATNNVPISSALPQASDMNGFESPSPKLVIKHGIEAISPEIQTENVEHSVHQVLKNNGEISEAPASQSGRKIHTPLKSLLEASIETQQEISQPNSQPQRQEHSSPRTRAASALASEQSGQPAVPRVVQKEWNSPARLPPRRKNSKGKAKGKPQWVPFMCCPSVK